MILLELNPLTRPVAISEMLLLLAGAAFIGWLIARLSAQGKIKALTQLVDTREASLADCVDESRKLISGKEVLSVVSQTTPDNLKIVEGIGPKIESLLNEHGIFTFAQLAAAEVASLSSILTGAGSRFQIHNPETWPRQAAMARDGRWEELEAWQEELNGGEIE